MRTALIIGSGPAAAGAALALARCPGLEITVLDLGLQLEADHRRAVDHLSSMEAKAWNADEVDLISAQPIGTNAGGRGLPEKRAYGSDFPFRDIGQLSNVSAETGMHHRLISAAYGGFSNVWGSQLMPFTAATFDGWPIASHEMQTHYKAILSQIPFAGEEDDLARLFPLMGPSAPLPELSPRTRRVLEAYARHRRALNKIGVTVGMARLALAAEKCARCGLCMTGCPYGLIYSASHTFDALRRAKRVAYHSGFLALQVSEEHNRAVVKAKELATGRMRIFEADRLYVACGAIGTTRLVLNSLRLFNQQVALQESAQFILPVISRRATIDLRAESHFTLNQFNMVVALDERGVDVSQLHFYTYNPAFIEALPNPFRAPVMQPVTAQLLRRLLVALGYLPSWASPRLKLRAQAPRVDRDLPEMRLSREDPRWHRNAMLRHVLTRVLRSSRFLDLWPVMPKMMLPAGGKSYHLGSSFPHGALKNTPFSSDSLGRVGSWQRIHLVDASVFPNVPATTFTLTIMANSHRIAIETLRLQP